MKRCIYFIDEKEFRLVRLFLDNLRLKGRMASAGISESDLEVCDIESETTHREKTSDDLGTNYKDKGIGRKQSERLSEEKELPLSNLPWSCQALVGRGYDKDVVIRAYQKWKELIDNCPEDEIITTTVEDIIKSELGNG